MSQENVEVVRALFEAWGRGGLDALAEFWDARIDWRAAEGALDDAGPIHGVDAMRTYVQDWLDDFDELRVEAEELIDAGEQAVAVQRISGRAKASGGTGCSQWDSSNFARRKAVSWPGGCMTIWVRPSPLFASISRRCCAVYKGSPNYRSACAPPLAWPMKP